MRLLWTVSNWKRTGPVEPSLSLAAAVAARGHDVVCAVGRSPPGETNTAEEVLVARSLRRAVPDARLSKHAFLPRDLGDVRRLARYLDAERPDAVVTTLPNDHRLALAAARRSGGTPVVRLWFSDGTSPEHRRDREALGRAARVVVFGDGPERALAELGFPAERVVRSGPPLDVRALRDEAPSRTEARRRLGVDEGVCLFGIVARLQRHRRFEMLWDAAARLREEASPWRLLVVGRGTWQEEVAFRPVRERGLAERVTFTGYLRGAEYAAALAALDAQLLLVPGSDPTCRALREGMALGVPSLATRRGLLPSIVEDGFTGVLVDDAPDALAKGMRTLLCDAGLRERLGRRAAFRAERDFAVEPVAAHLEDALGAVVAERVRRP
jgi:glycosyltransferase involved in cell wall biosynthesis